MLRTYGILLAPLAREVGIDTVECYGTYGLHALWIDGKVVAGSDDLAGCICCRMHASYLKKHLVTAVEAGFETRRSQLESDSVLCLTTVPEHMSSSGLFMYEITIRTAPAGSLIILYMYQSVPLAINRGRPQISIWGSSPTTSNLHARRL